MVIIKYNFVEGYLIKEELTMKTKKVIVAAMMAGIVSTGAHASEKDNNVRLEVNVDLTNTDNQQAGIMVPLDPRYIRLGQAVCETYNLKLPSGTVNSDAELEFLQSMLPYVDGVYLRAQLIIDKHCLAYKNRGKTAEQWAVVAEDIIYIYRTALDLMMKERVMSWDQCMEVMNVHCSTLTQDIRKEVGDDFVDPNPKKIGEKDCWGVNQATTMFWREWRNH